MASSADIKFSPGQGSLMKRVHGVKRQAFELKRLAEVRDRNRKKKREEPEAEEFAGSQKDLVHDGLDAGQGSGKQYGKTGKEKKKKKGQKVRGRQVNLII